MEDTMPAVMARSGRREVGLHAGNTEYSIFDKQSKTGPSNIWIKLLRRISVQSWSQICTISDIFTEETSTRLTLIFFVFGAARPFSGLFFRFLGLVLLTVKVMLVGVCCVAVYNTVEGESSSSQLSVALLSPPEKRLLHSSLCTNNLESTVRATYF